jgi:hypothetical protein
MHIVSNIGKHILGTLQTAFRRIFVAGLLVALIVAVGVEATSVFLSGGKFPPDGTTHLAAATPLPSPSPSRRSSVASSSPSN